MDLPREAPRVQLLLEWVRTRIFKQIYNKLPLVIIHEVPEPPAPPHTHTLDPPTAKMRKETIIIILTAT